MEARFQPQPAVLRSQPSKPDFQSKIPLAPPQDGDAASPAADPANPGGYANDGRFASGFAQVSSPVEQPSVMEEPVLPAVAEDPGCPEATGRAGTHMNGTAQHTEGAETHQADVSQAHGDPAHSQQPVSTDQVRLALPGPQSQPGSAVQPDLGLHGGQHTEHMEKVRQQCCCCVIM